MWKSSPWSRSRQKGFTCAHLALSKAVKEKPFVHGTMEITTPENATSSLKFLQDQYDSID